MTLSGREFPIRGPWYWSRVMVLDVTTQMVITQGFRSVIPITNGLDKELA